MINQIMIVQYHYYVLCFISCSVRVAVISPDTAKNSEAFRYSPEFQKRGGAVTVSGRKAGDFMNTGYSGILKKVVKCESMLIMYEIDKSIAHRNQEICGKNKKKIFGLCRNVQKTRTFMGVSPLPPGSPQCDNSREGNNSTTTLRRGGPGDRLCVPSFKACVLFILYWNKMNSTEPTFDD